LCILWQKIVLGYFHYLQMIGYLRNSFHYKRTIIKMKEQADFAIVVYGYDG
jgi:hypothetical protein